MTIAIAIGLLATAVGLIFFSAMVTKEPERPRIPLGGQWFHIGSYTAISLSTNASLHVEEDGRATLGIAGNLIMHYDSLEEAMAAHDEAFKIGGH